jgi:hypothetical protein
MSRFPLGVPFYETQEESLRSAAGLDDWFQDLDRNDFGFLHQTEEVPGFDSRTISYSQVPVK